MSTQRTSKGQRTKERILLAAADLFHERGINATSVGDVIRESGTGKGQFYLYFESRADLLQQVLKHHQEVLGTIRPDGITSWEDLKQFMNEHLEAQTAFRFRRGCPVGTAAYALQPDQSEARRVLKRIFSGMRKLITSFLEKEQAACRLIPTANPKKLADFTVACLQGGMLLALLERGPGPARAALDEAFKHISSHRIT